jgi:hypothetical protein
MPATTRYEETAFYRSELDNVKRENDALKRRVRELERMLRERRESDSSRQGRGRSESVSTTASANASVSGMSVGAASITGTGGGTSIAAQREAGRERPRVVSMMSTAGSVASLGVGVPEDEVRVGESAASAGLLERGADGHGGQEQGT